MKIRLGIKIAIHAATMIFAGFAGMSPHLAETKYNTEKEVRNNNKEIVKIL